ncbi:MAG: hypothetical protein H6R00_3346 [Proteobacteria bacterium]|nr:hypothetical protein [Pseudomonadota bacterium]
MAFLPAITVRGKAPKSVDTSGDQADTNIRPAKIVAPDVPWKQTASGKAFPLINAHPDDIDFDIDIAGALSRLARFTGDIRGGAYAVAQHSVMGADILKDETGDDNISAAFLLHDAHEGPIGDIATPAQDAINWHIQAALDDYGLTELICRNIPDLAGPLLFKRALKRLKSDLDRAIYGAAGMPWPLPAGIAAMVREMDLRMLAAEVDAFMGGEVAPWGALVEIRKDFTIPDLRPAGIWSAEVAEKRFQEALRRYLPERFPHPAFSIED